MGALGYQYQLSLYARIGCFMGAIRIALLLLCILPVMLWVIGWMWPELVLGQEAITPSTIWSLIGVSLSFFGLIFSAFAVLEVRSLSNRYFAKQRLPELKKQLDKVTGKMADVASLPLNEIRTERFMGEAAVILRHIKRTKAPGFSSVLKHAESQHAQIKKILGNEESLQTLARDIPEFWSLFSSLNELSDEIDAYNKGAQASL